MLHASTQKLIIKLCELTEAGHIAWKQGEGRAFRFETEGYVVEITGQPPTLKLLDADGRELERADEPDLAAEPWPDGNGAFATHITLLAARADRIARGAELAISRILSSLSAPPKAAPFDYLSTAAVKPAAEPSAGDRGPPPAPHTTPAPPPDRIASDTAIDRVLAIEPHPLPTVEPSEPEPVIVESEAAAIVGDPQAAEATLADTTSNQGLETGAEEASVSEPAPVVIEAEAVAIIAQPEPVEPPRLPDQLSPASESAPPVAPRPQSSFGATPSFAKPKAPAPGAALFVPKPEPPKPFSTSPLFFGVNELSHRPARTEPEPSPVPPPAAKSVPPASPAAEKRSEPAVAGPDIYKPWS